MKYLISIILDLILLVAMYTAAWYHGLSDLFIIDDYIALFVFSFIGFCTMLLMVYIKNRMPESISLERLKMFSFLATIAFWISTTLFVISLFFNGIKLPVNFLPVNILLPVMLEAVITPKWSAPK